MKILQIGKFCPPYFFGGIETVSYNLHNELQKKEGIQADFLGFLPKNYKDDIVVNEHIYLCKTDIDKFSAQLSKSFFKKFKQIRNEYEIIFVNMPHPVANMALLLYPPKKETKIVLYWHSDIIKQKFILFFYKPFLINLIKRSSQIIAPTSVHLDESDFSKYFVNKKKILPFILNYDTQASEYKLTKDNKKIVFACGRLIYYKGFDVLIDAAQYLSDDAEIHIAGTGKLRKKLEKQIQILGVQKKVKLLGKLSYKKLQEEYKNCYLFCFPSVNRGEMMGMVQFEAFSYGKPIVSTNIPRSGAPTLNKNGITGYVVPIFDSKALAEKINILINDEAVYMEMCNNAVIASENFNKNANVQDYIDNFRELLKK